MDEVPRCLPKRKLRTRTAARSRLAALSTLALTMVKGTEGAAKVKKPKTEAMKKKKKLALKVSQTVTEALLPAQLRKPAV